MSEEIIINNNAVSNCNLNMSYPAIRKTTKNFSMQNNKFAIIEFNDGENFFLVDKNYTDKFNNISDNIIPFEDKDDSITINLNNNIEHYQITQEINREYNVTDNLNPYIDDYFLDKDKIFIKFSEPIYFKNETNIFKVLEADSSYNSEKINYELLDPMTLMLSNPSFDLLNIAIENKFIFDLSSNSNILMDTLLTITNNSHFSDKKSGGNVFGKIIYEGKNDVIVEAVNLLNSKVNKVKMDKFGNYKFYNNKSIRGYIKLAGGLTVDAETKEILVTYPDGTSRQLRPFTPAPRVYDGSIITVGIEKETEPLDKTEFAKEVASILSDFLQIALTFAILTNNSIN